jgi:hypothetical protein
MKQLFLEQRELLDLIYRLRVFKSEDLLIQYNRTKTKLPRESNETVLDYLNQLTEIKVLKNVGGQFSVKSSLLR